MRLQTPINVKSLRLDEGSLEYQKIAQAAMAKVALVTDPPLSKEQRQVMYEIHMPGMSGNTTDMLREVTPAGQIVDIVQDTSNPKQTYTNSKTNGIAGTTARRETVNGFLVDFVE